MSEGIIILKNVSKKYFFKNRLERDIKFSLNSFFNRQEFWALKNINLKINNGEHIGFLGKNGAGKTVLLKIISGVIHPSCGCVFVKKSISPIFEYGAGFHPEFTGRENIFLYGSLLGIRKELINKNFDEIVAFSELKNFLDLKIKYYSTGMKIRLAFSVASLLKPEILLLDEALSVGDQGFVRKIHDRIKELQKENVTMLITSHSIEILIKFCKKGIVLDKGEMVFNGEINSAINYYKKNILHEDSDQKTLSKSLIA